MQVLSVQQRHTHMHRGESPSFTAWHPPPPKKKEHKRVSKLLFYSTLSCYERNDDKVNWNPATETAHAQFVTYNGERGKFVLFCFNIFVGSGSFSNAITWSSKTTRDRVYYMLTKDKHARTSQLRGVTRYIHEYSKQLQLMDATGYWLGIHHAQLKLLHTQGTLREAKTDVTLSDASAILCHLLLIFW